MRDDETNTQQKLDQMSRHLEEVKRIKEESAREVRSTAHAAQPAIDLTSACAVGMLLGYGFDQWQDTLPWGLLVGLFVGTAAGIKMIFEHQAKELRDAERNQEK
jgi:F0F1-type ATP synthase assembly protein I